MCDYFDDIKFRTQKGEDFRKWKKCFELMKEGKHNSKEGLLEICNLRDSMNYRKVKNKRDVEEINQILENNLGHISAHKDNLIHNNSGGTSSWFEKNKGNHLPSKNFRPKTDVI